jgi:hypothetical protein
MTQSGHGGHPVSVGAIAASIMMLRRPAGAPRTPNPCAARSSAAHLLRDTQSFKLGQSLESLETLRDKDLSRPAESPNVAVRFKMLIKRRVGLTLGLGRALMHGIAPQMCGRVASPLLGLGAGGRSPGYLMRGVTVAALTTASSTAAALRRERMAPSRVTNETVRLS